MTAAAIASVAGAVDNIVSDATKVVLDTGDSVSPSAAAIPDALPGSATPLFRFDASVTTGWEFDANDAAKITKIPSLAGDRFLTVDKTGGDWTASWPNAPSLVNDPTLGGGKPCVDFGAAGSTLGLLFNPATGGSGIENRLYGIGTVIAVLNSEQGGGTLLGGGSGPNNGGTNTGFYFRRGLAAATPGTAWDPLDSSSVLFRWYTGASGDVAAKVAALGTVYLDGRPVAPAHHGLSGGWDVVSLQPTEASLNAHGVGLGAIGSNYTSNFSGGQRMAELIVYDQVISDEDRAAVERYLQRKWFGRDARGYGENAVVDTVRVARNAYASYESNGAVAKAVIGEGETLTVKRLFGGRGGWSSFNVSGGGTLKLGTASEYQGTVRSHGAKLAFDRRATPSALPAGAIAHFDVADAGSIHENETGVYQWDSQSDFQLNGHKLALYYETDHAGQVPKKTATGPGGCAALDFWCSTGTGVNGAYLRLVYADTLAQAKAQGVSTVVAVIRPYKFGHYLCGPFDGADPSGVTATSYFNPSAYNSTWSQPLFNANANASKHPTLSGANANRMWTDGLRHDHATGYAHNGWQVVAIQGPGSQFGALGAGAHYYYAGGGFEVAEIAYFCRQLSEDEILDAQAYLSDKWFGRETAGYRRNADRARVDDVATLEVVGPTEIEVAAGDVVRIGKLACDARLRKTGAGTLEVKTLLNGAANLVVEEGKVVKAALATPADNETPAKDPAAWFDASDAKYFAFKTDPADTSFAKAIATWYDRTGCLTAYHDGGHPGWYDETTDALNGKAIVSFGSLGGSAYRFLRFSKPIDGIKAAFVVIGSQDGGGCLLGQYNTPSYACNQMRDFNRSNPYSTESTIIEESANTQHVWGGNGAIYINGEKVKIGDAKLGGSWDLVEVYPDGAAHASAFAYQYGDSSVGRTRLAEVILYERELTEKEKVATRNYLLKKWGLGAPQAEPEEPVRSPDVTIAALKNGADYVKDEPGTLSIMDVNSYTGKVTVNAGTLALAGRKASGAAPSLVTDGLVAQFDATSGIVPGTDVRGRPCVSEWIAKTGGYKAVADTKGFPPTYAAAGLNGKPTVNLTECTWNHWMFMHFTDLAGNRTEIAGIKTVLWVIGSQEGGGFLLGGGHNPAPDKAIQHYCFHRGGAAGANAADALVSGAAQIEVQSADWRVNGQAVVPTSAGLSGGWDIVSMALKSSFNYLPGAEGFAFDGRFDPENGEYNYDSRSGNQRLAEVLIYDRILTADEIAATEAYLAEKWGVNNQAGNGLSVELAAGATLDVGEAGHVASVTGAGVVSGDVSVGTLSADYAAPNAGLAVNGTLKIAPHQAVRVKNAPANPGVVDLLVATAQDYAGIENCDGIVVSGIPQGVGARLRIKNGKLILKIGRRGSLLLIR